MGPAASAAAAATPLAGTPITSSSTSAAATNPPQPEVTPSIYVTNSKVGIIGKRVTKKQ
jgi:hypothetical protein